LATKKKKTTRSATAKKKTTKTAGKRAATKAFGARKSATAARKRPVKKAPVRKTPPEAKGPPENPEALALARRVGRMVLDRKAADVVILDVRGRTSYADYLVLASGESERHVASMAEGLEVKLKEDGQRPMSTEGHTPGQWVLIDYGDVVVHLFANEARAFYDLEGVWPDVPKEHIA
jgi:ribosome-associated protein